MSEPARESPIARPRTWLRRWSMVALGAALLALYLPTLARGVTFSDGPEIVTAITTLGITHPTGYPIFTLAAHYFALLLPLPLKQCVKIELFNVLCAVGAALFTARATRELVTHWRGARRGGAAERDARAAGLVAGLLLGTAPLFWEQVRIPEVYPFHVLLVAWAAYAWIRFEVARDELYILAAALPMGIGLAHHVTMVYMLPAAFLYLLARRPFFFVAWLVYPPVRFIRIFKREFLARVRFARWWTFPAAILTGGVPLTSYLFLLWSDKHSTGLPWGDVTSWDGLWGHMTGRQYQKFMHGATFDAQWARLKIVPDIFDAQFLPLGTFLFTVGLYVLVRRAPRIGLFLVAFLLLNIAHGVHYSVGDYGNYYLPGLYVCAVLMGAGLFRALGWARARSVEARSSLLLGVAGVFLATAAITLYAYVRLTKRVPASLDRRVLGGVVIGLAVLGALALAAAVVARTRPALLERLGFARALLCPTSGALPALLFFGSLAALTPALATRVWEMSHEELVGESYGAELATNIPSGSVLMTQGDGFLFTMWYEAHVLGHADFMTVDTGNIRTPWYVRYMTTRFPEGCDPLAAPFALDPAAYERKCGTFRQRLSVKAAVPWASMGHTGARSGRIQPRDPPLEALRGGDARCADATFMKEHAGAECKCWEFAHKTGVWFEDCVQSADEGGVVWRDAVEIFAQRIIEDSIDERPVFERNVLTHWSGRKDNLRDWDGPSYQRVSAEYALLNRGRYNQIVHSTDLGPSDPCRLEVFRPISLRRLGAPRDKARAEGLRRHYVPNEWPTLVAATLLAATPAMRDDDASRTFVAGDEVRMRFDWFEKFYYDRTKPDHRGAPVRHGVRVCFFDADGRRVATQTLVSMKAGPPVTLKTEPGAKPGVYHVEACTLGEVGEQMLPADLEAMDCKRVFLEYPFTVTDKR